MRPPATGERLEQISRAMTDGQFSDAQNNWLWRDRTGVAEWKYEGIIHMAVDLEEPHRISEIAIRLLGGSYEWGGQGKSFPSLVEAFVSQDGKNYIKVGEFSRWKEGDFEKFSVPGDDGTAWVHNLQFQDMDVTGRWVGLRVYGHGMAATDELTVLGRPETEGEEANSARRGEPSGFTIHSPYLYFHKPYIELATNAVLPVPVGLRAPSAKRKYALTLTLDVPHGLELAGGSLGTAKIEDLSPELLGDGTQRYQIRLSGSASHPMWNQKHAGKFFFQASGWQDNQQGELVYRFEDDAGWSSPEKRISVRAVEVPEAPRLKKIMASLGWWYVPQTQSWPDALNAFRTIGLNTFAFSIAESTDWDEEGSLVTTLREFQEAGFMASVTDLTIRRMEKTYEKDPEIFCQFADGEVSNAPCPSYRGPFWEKEVERFANMMATIQPNFHSSDIEIWKAADRADFDFSHQAKETRTCTRCQRDFEASGLSNGDVWKRHKGLEMWRELMTAAREAMIERGGSGEFRVSGYNFRPGQTYQTVWNFNMLFNAGLLDHSQVSTYTSLYPYHIAWIGDRVREDREKVEANGGSVMPWLTPGDAGPLPGEAFQWSLLESFANGADGIWFWSHRLWDAELLIAYNRVIRAIAPVEEVITEGKLIGDAVAIQGPGRVSGMRLGDRMILLVADYAGESEGRLTLELEVPEGSSLRNLLQDTVIAERIPAGRQLLELDLHKESALFLEVFQETP